MDNTGKKLITIVIVIMAAYMMLGLVGFLPQNLDVVKRATGVEGSAQITEYDLDEFAINPMYIAMDNVNGNIFLTNLHLGTDSIVKYNIASGEKSTLLRLEPFSTPNEIVLDKSGLLWTTQLSIDHLLYVSSTDIGGFGYYNLPPMSSSLSLDVDSIGDIYMTDYSSSGMIYQFDKSEDDIVTHDGFAWTYGIDIDAEDNKWITMPLANKILKYTPELATYEYEIPYANFHPRNIIVDNDGNVFADGGDFGNKLLKMSFESGEPVFDVYQISTYLETISDFVVDDFGSIWMSGGRWFEGDFISYVYSFNIEDKVMTSYAIPTHRAQPIGLGIDSNNNLWFAEKNVNKLGKLKIPISLEHFENSMKLELMQVGEWEQGSPVDFRQVRGQDVVVKAEIKSVSNISTEIANVKLFYIGVGVEGSTVIVMELAGGDIYEATIPAQGSEGTLVFKIEAENGYGYKLETDYYEVTIYAPPTPQQITLPSMSSQVIYGVGLAMLVIVGVAINKPQMIWRRK